MLFQHKRDLKHKDQHVKNVKHKNHFDSLSVEELQELAKEMNLSYGMLPPEPEFFSYGFWFFH